MTRRKNKQRKRQRGTRGHNGNQPATSSTSAAQSWQQAVGSKGGRNQAGAGRQLQSRPRTVEKTYWRH